MELYLARDDFSLPWDPIWHWSLNCGHVGLVPSKAIDEAPHLAVQRSPFSTQVNCDFEDSTKL